MNSIHSFSEDFILAIGVWTLVVLAWGVTLIWRNLALLRKGDVSQVQTRTGEAVNNPTAALQSTPKRPLPDRPTRTDT
jgi:hypothetical protein